MKKKIDYAYPSLGARFQQEWKIYLLAFLFIIVADSIGQIKIPVWKGTFIIFPIFYALILGILCGPSVLKLVNHKGVRAASGLVGVAILPFISKLGINAGANIMAVVSAGPALILQEFGNIGTIVLALPLALLLGLKKEAIGATHSINRETNLALMQDMYGSDSPQARGSLSVYIIGGMVGTIYFGFMATMFAATGLFHPYALGMASGVGAGILMSSAVASLSAIMPQFADQIAAFASASETISGIDGIYMALFIGVPLANWMYKHLEPTLGRVTKAGRVAAAAIEAEEAAAAAAALNAPETSTADAAN